MDEVTLNDFPREILEEIFSYLPGDSLIQSMQVCNRFNEIIGCCTKLMNKVQICFDGKKDNNTYPHFVMESKRKYSSLCLKNNVGLMGEIEDFVSDRSTLLTHLNFERCGLKSSELGLIIDYVREKLEVISFTGVFFVKNVTAVPLDFPKLKSITFNGCEGCCAVTDYFKNAPAVQKFYFSKDEEYPLSAEELEKFTDLLISFDGLKDLEFKYDLSQEIFSTGRFANEARFKLDRLALHMGPDFSPDENDEIFIPDPENHPIDHPVAVYDHYENFYAFLNEQRCLKELKLTRFTISSEFLELILGINGLKELSLVGCDYQILRKAYVKSVSIETLYFDMGEYSDEGIEPNSSIDTGICETIRGCAAIKTLKFDSCGPTVNICTTVLSTLKQLTCMRFHINGFGANMQPMNFPTVKTMEINGFDADDKILALLQVNRQVKHVTMGTHAVKDLPKFKELIAELNIENIIYK